MGLSDVREGMSSQEVAQTPATMTPEPTKTASSERCLRTGATEYLGSTRYLRSRANSLLASFCDKILMFLFNYST